MFKLVTATIFLTVSQAAEFQIINRENSTIWVGIQGYPGYPHLNSGGFELPAGQSRSVFSQSDWRGRLWGRTWCNAGTKHCLTGDCGNKLKCNGNGGNPPVSSAEITLKGAGGLDFYDISLVDGFNLPLTVEPVGGQGDGSQYSCKPASCRKHLIDECPNDLKLQDSGGTVVGCNSACSAFHTDQYCCRGAHSSPEKCKSSDWPVNYPKFFKDRCPDAYSYAYDDYPSTFTCKAKIYIITFGI